MLLSLLLFVGIPASGQIAEMLTMDEVAVAGVVNLEAVSKLASLLPLSPYQAALLEGLIVGIGGVDASLAKAASSALLQQLECSGQGLEQEVAGKVVALWEKEARCVVWMIMVQGVPCKRKYRGLYQQANMAGSQAWWMPGTW